MTGIRPGYSVPSSGAGAGERPSSSLTEPEQGREPGHGQCCLNTFGDGKKYQIKVERLIKNVGKFTFVIKRIFGEKLKNLTVATRKIV